MLFKIICPVPSGAMVIFWFEAAAVVMLVATPEKVSVPVVVIAPEEIVPILTKLPDASILLVPLV